MRFRAPEMADAPAVLAVLEARDRADLGEVEHALEDVIGEWALSDFDLERGARVVDAPEGGIVAYAAVRRHGAFAVVAPEREGRGIGSRLLEWAEQRERDLGRALHRQWVAGANASASTLLTRAGYHCARSYYRMVRSLDGAPAGPAIPAGYAVRSVDVMRDVEAMHAVDAESFARSPDYEPESLAEFTEEHLNAHDFDAGLSGVATRDGRIVGFLLAGPRPEERVGYVHILAVAPEHQGRGVGSALLLRAFAGFAQAGLREARLGVASYNERGLRVYGRAGMTMRHRFDIYERPVGPPPSRWRSYREVDAADDPALLAEQLDAIASVSFVAAEKRRSLELLGLARGDSVLDAGCGTGTDLKALSEIVGPQGRVIGLERSAELIAAARARRRDGSGGIELVQGDVCGLPFGTGEFSACRADRTLQHLASPDAGLREMVRVTRAGGRVAVTESRWGLVAPDLDQDLTNCVLARVASETEPREWIGYRLEDMLAQAGLTDVQTVSADYTAGECEELLRFTHLPAAVADAVAAGAITDAQASGWLEHLRALMRGGEAFAMVLILHVWGTKPNAAIRRVARQ